MKNRRKEEPVYPLILPDNNGSLLGKVPTDPLGSYTGRPEDPYEVPVQDADDL